MQAYPALQGDTSCDVLVVGGGITGALIAFHLIEAGIDTVLIDKREIGWGSTSATTGLIQYEIDTPLSELSALVGAEHASRAYLALLDSVHRMEQLVDRLDDRSGFERKHSLYLARRRGDVELLKTEYELRRRLGFRLDWLDRRDVSSRYSFSRPAALLSYDAAQIDAYRLTHTLLGHARRAGLRVFDRSEVLNVESDRSGMTAHVARRTKVQARHVVFATGYESETFLGEPVAKLVSTWALVSEPLRLFDGWNDQSLIWEHAQPYFYLRTTGDGRAMVGGEDEPFGNPRLRDRLIARKTRKLARRFAALFPHIPFDVAFAWTGTFAETRDGLAYIGTTSSDRGNVWFALCYGGNGISYGLLAAEIIRDGILGRRHEYADLFHFGRGHG